MALDQSIVDHVRHQLAVEALEPTAASVARLLRTEHRVVGSSTVLRIVDELRTEAYGAGLLEPLLAVPGVTDVMVNGPDAVYLDRGQGLERQPTHFGDETAVRRLAQRLAAQAGRRLDDTSPWVDARLPDSTRLHAVLAPIARPGTTICLRIPARRTLSLDDLQELGAVDPVMVKALRAIVARRTAFVVCGGTGSGKTTILSALLAAVDPGERIVIVEDASELRPDHPHVVALEARPPNVEGAGSVELRDLVRQALRMRPDRLVVGEVRGPEVVDLMAALNTGHEGGCGTVHANVAAAVPARFEALGVAAGLSRDAVHSQLASSVQVVIHVSRGGDHRRIVSEVGVVTRRSDGLVDIVPALSRTGSVTRRGEGFELFARVVGRG